MLFDFFHIQIAGTEIWIWAGKLGLAAAIVPPLFLIVRALMNSGEAPKGLGGPFDGLGDTGEDDFDGDEIIVESVKTYPTKRRIVSWLGNGKVVAVSAQGEEFVGQIVHRSLTWRHYNGGWVLVRNPDRRWACWCQLPAPV